jgi:hypothetical protein
MILSGLEGAMLVARPYGDVDRFMTTASQLLASVEPAAAQRARPSLTSPTRLPANSLPDRRT